MKPVRTLLFFAVALAACRGNKLQGQHNPPDAGMPFCGDGNVDPGEQCDGTNLDGGDCIALGFDPSGPLSCTAMCTYDTSHCTKHCGNGVLDQGEACDGTLGNLTCATWGYDVCTAQCTIDHSHCGVTAFAAGIPFIEPEGGNTILATVPPDLKASLVLAEPSPIPRLKLYPYDLNAGFGLNRRLLDMLGTMPLTPIAADVDGDGQIDLAALNVDGSVDRYLYGGAMFTASSAYPVPGACPATTWVGSGHLADAGGPADLVGLACPSSAVLRLPGGVPAPAALLITDGGVEAAALGDQNGDGVTDLLVASDGGAFWWLGSPAGLTPGPSAALPISARLLALADFDGDGALDLAAADATQIYVFQTDGGWVQRQTFAAAGTVSLLATDLDFDGRPDFAWLDAAGVHVRRNQGNFVFSAFDYPIDAGTPQSLSAGDLEGDGDLDLAASFNQGGPRTFVQPLLNGVK